MIKKVMVIALIAITFTGCKKEAGPKGDKGDPGVNGNANVISTGSVTLNLWTYFSSNDSYLSLISVSAINQAVVDKGAVLAYIETANGWSALPFHGMLTFYDDIQYEIDNGFVNIWYKENSPAATINPTSQAWKVRFVVIPASNRIANVNHNNYNEVKSAYNLKD